MIELFSVEPGVVSCVACANAIFIVLRPPVNRVYDVVLLLEIAVM